MTAGLLWKIGLATAFFFAPALRTLGAAEDPPPAFQKAYYLETHEHDLAAAARLYKQVADDRSAPAGLREEARNRLACCVEDLRSADLARLMPADAIFYAELRNPGAHLEQLAKMLDVIGNPLTNIGAAAHPVPGEEGVVIPQRILLSPSLLAQAKSFSGVAVAMTGFNVEADAPEGVLVLHPGDAGSLRGLIETGAQFVRADDPVSGFPTIAIEEDGMRVFTTFTARLVIVGSDRSLIEDVLARLQSDDAASLATNPAFTTETARRDDAMLYGFVNMQEALKLLYRQMQQNPSIRDEMMQAQLMLDIAHMNSVSLAVGAGSDALTAEFAMSLAPEQTSLIYNLLRTPPMNGRVLKMIPPESAAFFAIGINPQSSPDGAQDVATKTQTVQAVTGLDLGRELFANIREAAVYVVPPTDNRTGNLPDVGLVLAVGDPAKSEALWSYLLALPGQMAGRAEDAPQVETLHGVEVSVFSIDQGVDVRLARHGESIFVGLTARATEAALAAQRSGRSVLDEPDMKAPLERITADTSVALVAHAGRLASLASAYAPPQEKEGLAVFAHAARDLQATLVIDESQTRLRAAGRLAGLPRLSEVLEALAQAGIIGGQGEPAVRHAPAAAEPIVVTDRAEGRLVAH